MGASKRLGSACGVAMALLACSSSPSPAGDAGPTDASTTPDVLLLPEGGLIPDSGSDAVTVADAAGDADASAHVCPTSEPLDCSPGTGTGAAGQCFDGPSCYVTKVQKAVNAVVAQNPTWFDFNNQWSCPGILDINAYMDAVVAQLVAGSLCAIRDPNAPNAEVTVKHDNAFSENFNIAASNGCARSGSAIYTGWCAPAWW
ncbi:MAG TPA: hypothetical protein VLM85_13095 [Polyangiaceae bacterium]|nr:hypothetical protein [Polyangiaceae bacterium]